MEFVGHSLEPIQVATANLGKVWGGTRMGIAVNGLPVGERWILSTRPEGMSTIATGPYAGISLFEYLQKTGAAGFPVESFEDFPVLIKQLETGSFGTSVQVHPDDAYAQTKGLSCGKDEIWIIEDANPESRIYHGVKRALTAEELLGAVEDGTVCSLLSEMHPSPGDVFRNPAGCIHAIGAKIWLWEVQQNSDTTYRMYDFDTLDEAGKSRELHLEDALQVAHLQPEPSYAQQSRTLEGGTAELLYSSRDWECERYIVEGKLTLPLFTTGFVALCVLAGEGQLILDEWNSEFHASQCWFVPAQTGELIADGALTLLVTRAVR